MAEPITDREFFEMLIKEMDRRVEQRFADLNRATVEALAASDKATAAALAAADKLTTAAFDAGTRAVEKAEAAQKAYNEHSNGLRLALDTSARDKVGRAEFDVRFSALTERTEQADKNLLARLDIVEKTLAAASGRSGGSAATIAMIFSTLSAVATVVGLFIVFSK